VDHTEAPLPPPPPPPVFRASSLVVPSLPSPTVAPLLPLVVASTTAGDTSVAVVVRGGDIQFLNETSPLFADQFQEDCCWSSNDGFFTATRDVIANPAPANIGSTPVIKKFQVPQISSSQDYSPDYAYNMNNSRSSPSNVFPIPVQNVVAPTATCSSKFQSISDQYDSMEMPDSGMLDRSATDLLLTEDPDSISNFDPVFFEDN
jgi:hypothetical protein